MDDDRGYRVPAVKRSNYAVIAQLFGCLSGIVSCFLAYLLNVWYDATHFATDGNPAEGLGIDQSVSSRNAGIYNWTICYNLHNKTFC